ncbi:MAG: class I SAM-dependent methyltransferase, partial [Pseudomonadota bacterium]
MTTPSLFFTLLEEANRRPAPFSRYTARELWTNEHTSARMLEYHLNEHLDVSSRRASFIDQSVRWCAQRFGVSEGTRIADFGCGPGLYCSRFAEIGADVAGIDFSARSIGYARADAARRSLEITYHEADYLAFELDGEFDLILMVMCDLCALSPAQRGVLLSRFQRLLASGGRVLLDLYSMRAFDEKVERAYYEKNQLNGFWSPEPYYGFV